MYLVHVASNTVGGNSQGSETSLLGQGFTFSTKVVTMDFKIIQHILKSLPFLSRLAAPNNYNHSE